MTTFYSMISGAKPFHMGQRLLTRPALLASFCFVCLFSAVFLSACGSSNDQQWQLSGATMGTTYHITVVDPELSISQSELQKRVDQVLAQVNQEMSTYIEDSELNRLNRAEINEWLPVSEAMFQIFKVSQEVSALTQGALDVTVGPLVNLWGFGPEKSAEIPPREVIDKALDRIGYRHIQLRPRPMSIRKDKPLYIDLSSCAKGYGTDRVAVLFDSLGLSNYLIEIGGELFVRGLSPRKTKWRIGVETPSLMQSGVERAILISDVGVATSGGYRNYFEKNGKRYSHTIDPTTGFPVTHNLASVTVIADTGAKADALATGLNVLGAVKGMALAEAEGIAAFFISKEGDTFQEVYSPAFSRYLEKVKIQKVTH